MNILTKDNFLPNADATRAAVLGEDDFSGQEFQGHFYSGVHSGSPLEGAQELIEDVVERTIYPEFAFWRLSKPGEDTPAPIHADGSCAKYAGLLYMSPPPEERFDGTAFWGHKELGVDHIPASMLKGSQDRSSEFYKTVNADSADESKWDMRLLVKSKFNRFVTYPTHYFHSRYPFYSENYGDSNQDARLIWVVFYS